MPYQLTITQDDIKAFNFVGGRYACGSCDLLEFLLGCEITEYLDTNKEDPDYDYGFTVALTESQKWEVAEFMDCDTENMTTSHPLLGGPLWAKLTVLYDSIV